MNMLGALWILADRRHKFCMQVKQESVIVSYTGGRFMLGVVCIVELRT